MPMDDGVFDRVVKSDIVEIIAPNNTKMKVKLASDMHRVYKIVPIHSLFELRMCFVFQIYWHIS